MAKQKQLPTNDRILLIAGIVSMTFIAAFLANNFLKGHTGLLIVEIALYAGIATMYIQTFRTSHIKNLVQIARITSYVTLTAAVLILSFIAYFTATFRW